MGLSIGGDDPVDPVDPIYVVQMGTDDDDVLNGLDDQRDALIGKAGDDRLNGASDDDLLIDGAGSDISKGDAGDDILVFEGGAMDRGFGGSGADIFKLSDDYSSNGTTDRVKVVDFDASEDKLDLSGAVIASVTGLNKEVQLTLAGEDDVVVLRGVTAFDDIMFTSIDLPELDMSDGGDPGDGDGGDGGDPGDSGDPDGLMLSTLENGFRLRGAESDDMFMFFGGETTDALGNGGSDTFVLKAALFENGITDKVKIRDYSDDDVVDISGFAINEVKELNNRVQVFIGPDNDLVEFVNLSDFDDIVFVTDLPLS